MHRAGVVLLGGVIVLAGIVLSGPGVPGPGFLVILIGLGFLALEFDRAERRCSSARSSGATGRPSEPSGRPPRNAFSRGRSPHWRWSASSRPRSVGTCRCCRFEDLPRPVAVPPRLPPIHRLAWEQLVHRSLQRAALHRWLAHTAGRRGHRPERMRRPVRLCGLTTETTTSPSTATAAAGGSRRSPRRESAPAPGQARLRSHPTGKSAYVVNQDVTNGEGGPRPIQRGWDREARPEEPSGG